MLLALLALPSPPGGPSTNPAQRDGREEWRLAQLLWLHKPVAWCTPALTLTLTLTLTRALPQA